MAFSFPDIDPVIVHVFGPLTISWYGLSYAVGITLGYFYVACLVKKYALRITAEQLDSLLGYLMLLGFLGARLVYVTVYDPASYVRDPMEILRIYNGGLSFHGGLAGTLIGPILFCKKHNFKFFEVSDLIAAAAPITIFLARIANFINAELYGRVTDFKWAVLFPPDFLPRHPSQIYEALSEGLISFLALWLLITWGKAIKRPGLITGTFLLCYSISRMVCELFREPDNHLGFIFEYFTMGQLLSLPMLAAGLYILWISPRYRSQ